MTDILEEDLTTAYQGLQDAWNSEGGLPLRQRIRLLRKLAKAIKANRTEIAEAINHDFGARSPVETLAAEVYLSLEAIRHARANLRDWVEPMQREVSWVFYPSKAKTFYQPLGVVGIIAPWNYPFYLAISPLVGALAAGNRILIKPSEFTPKYSALLQKIIADALPKDVVRVVVGDADVGAAFSKLPFDHLFFTGSTRVGRLVMKAASENLTPVTLELGGKSPALVHPKASLKKAAQAIAAGKMFNAGQTCVAPDYVLCPKDDVDALVGHLKQSIANQYPTLEKNPDFTSLINSRSKERLQSLLVDAEENGASTIIVNPGNEEMEAKMAPVLVTGVTDEMTMMQQELFGPILPIVPYANLDDAISYINARPRPLTLYLFSKSGKQIQRVLKQTRTGSVCVNNTLVHLSQEDLPFGGIGASGMGQYHGFEGFVRFSHQRAVFHQSALSPIPWISRAPYGKFIRFILRILIR